MTQGKRARDADRDLTVGVLEEAYVDGQLDVEEHRRRVARALEAAYLADLRALLTDLQGEKPAALSEDDPPVAPRVAPPATEQRSASRWVGAVVAVLLVVGGGTAVVVSQSAGSGSAPSSVEAEAHAVQALAVQALAWDEVELSPAKPEGATVRLPGQKRWALREDRLAALVTAWSEQMGPYVTTVTIRPDDVHLTRPVAATSPTTEEWVYGDEGPGRAYLWVTHDVTAADTPILDLRDLDIARLVDNIERAETDLGLPDASLSWVSVKPTPVDGVPEVGIWVRDAATNDVAWLTTTLAGRVVDEHPHQPEG